MKLLSELGITRMWQWAILSLCTSVAIFVAYPHQLGVVLFKLNLLSVAAWLGYWIDRAAFRNRITPASSTGEQLRRAVVIGTTMLAMSIAL